MLLGAGHAFLPGHGKTVMAAYLVGKKGRVRDVVTVGATVTLTHTAGVLILGLLITLGAQFATVVVEQDLAIISGGTVALVGIGLLASAVRRRRAERVSVESHLAHLEVDTLAVEEALVHQESRETPTRTLVLHGASAEGMVTALAEPHPHARPRPRPPARTTTATTTRTATTATTTRTTTTDTTTRTTHDHGHDHPHARPRRRRDALARLGQGPLPRAGDGGGPVVQPRRPHRLGPPAGWCPAPRPSSCCWQP